MRFKILLLILLLCGCTTTSLQHQKLASLDHKITTVDSDLNESIKIYTKAINDTLSFKVEYTKEDLLALRFTTELQSIVGLPSTQPFDVKKLLDEDKMVRALEEKKLLKLETGVAESKLLKEQLIKEKKAVISDIIDRSAFDARTQQTKFWTKVKNYGFYAVLAAVLSGVCYLLAPLLPIFIGGIKVAFKAIISLFK